jgi:hypothetical protein
VKCVSSAVHNVNEQHIGESDYIPSCIYKHRELVSTNMLKYGIYMYGHVTYAINVLP